MTTETKPRWDELPEAVTMTVAEAGELLRHSARNRSTTVRSLRVGPDGSVWAALVVEDEMDDTMHCLTRPDDISGRRADSPGRGF